VERCPLGRRGSSHRYSSGGGPFQETAGLAVDSEHVPHLLLQFGVPATGFGDVAPPLLLWQLADSVQEQFAGFEWISWHGTSLPVRHL
jgi:hypothetical protein